MMLLIILYAILGFTFTLSKIMLAYASPVFLVGTRMLLAGIGIWGYAHVQGLRARKLVSYDWFLIAQFALFGVVGTHVARAWALQRLPTVKAALLFNFSPFFSALFAYFLVKERLSLMQILGLLIGFTGLLPLFLAKEGANLSNLLTHFSLPDFVMLIAVASFSYSLLVMQKLVRHTNCSPVLANGLSMFIGGIFTCNAAIVTEPVWLLKGDLMFFIGLLTVNILLSNVVCANLQAFLLKKYSSTALTFTSFLSPFFAAGYSWILLKEQPTANAAIAGALVFSGLSIYFYKDLHEAYKKQQLLSTSTTS